MFFLLLICGSVAGKNSQNVKDRIKSETLLTDFDLSALFSLFNESIQEITAVGSYFFQRQGRLQ